jgi:tripartite ATP-independent transporter DctM subunit
MALGSLVATFGVLLLSGFPIAFALLFGSITYLLVAGYPLTLVSQRMFEGMNGFPLLAVPFFVLTGELMMKGGIVDPLIRLVNALVGRIRGALALVAVLGSLFMGAIVGLAVAAAASIGAFLVPMMKKEGYGADFAAAVAASSSLLGPIMPPSVLMILYAMATGRTSIAGMFLGSIIPAVLIAAAQMVVIGYIAQRRRYPQYAAFSWKERLHAFRDALPVLILPLIILGGIFGGVFTVTEASAVAALYALVLGTLVYRKLRWVDYLVALKNTALTSGLVILLAGAGSVTSWAIANERLVYQLVEPLSRVQPWMFLLVLNILLLLNGMFMDDYASVVVLGPILAPIGWALGIDPIHIGVIICVNLVIGLATPPFGIALFVTCPMAGVTLEQNVRQIIPMVLASIAVLFLITYVPGLVLWLPRLAGY